MTDRRQPAEWGTHQACWLAWPSHPDLWGRRLEGARGTFVELCQTIRDGGRGEALEVLVLDDEGEAQAEGALAGLGARFHRVPFGDIWLRDTAPIFVRGPDGLEASRFTFNGWGGKYVLAGDAEVADRIAQRAAVVLRAVDLVLEGGAVEVDGEGWAITTRQCALDPNRNPTVDEAWVEARLSEAVGADRVLWLEDGLRNDHTDGHVDTLARFVGPGRVVCARPDGLDDPNHAVLSRVEATLQDAGLDLEFVPSPGSILDADGALMPASYLNFYIANTTLAVPVWGVSQDEAALASLAALFPSRRVVPIDCRDLLTGGGALHCITQQEPTHE